MHKELGAAFALLLGIGVALSASTLPAQAAITAPEAAYVDIGNDSGGRVIDYAVRLYEMKDSETKVRFVGRCDSACTLFLAMPNRAMCVRPGAYFRFHAPFGVSSVSVSDARNFLMQEYPDWVRKWLARQGGLTDQLLTMDYDTASKHIRNC